MRCRIDVAKNRRDLLPLQGMGRRDKGERRDNHLAFQAQRANDNLQRHRGVAHDNAMFHAEKAAQFLLKFLNVIAVIGKPAAFQNVTRPLEEPLAIADIRLADMKFFLETRLSAKDRPIIWFSFYNISAHNRHKVILTTAAGGSQSFLPALRAPGRISVFEQVVKGPIVAHDYGYMAAAPDNTRIDEIAFYCNS
jgi:hypothetical protein